MARLDDMHVSVVYEYAPETLMSAGDFDALMKAKQEIDAAWAALAEINNGCFAAPYQHVAPAIKSLHGMLKEWQAGYAIEARRSDEYRAARNELAEQLKACQAKLEAATTGIPPDAKLYHATMRELAEMKRQLAEIESAYADKDKYLQEARAECASALNCVDVTNERCARLQAEIAKLQHENTSITTCNAGLCSEHSALRSAYTARTDHLFSALQSAAKARKERDELKDALDAVARSNDEWFRINEKLANTNRLNENALAGYLRDNANQRAEIETLTRERDRLASERDALLEANDYNIRCAGNLNTHVIALEVEKQRLEKECAANLVAVMSAGKSVAEYSDKCAKLELRSGKLNARIRRMRGALLKIEETYESVAKLHSMAYQALVDEEELAQEQERVCGAS